ncbi:hypothetical protein WJX79_004890 [Trebouxia sp. C0005]
MMDSGSELTLSVLKPTLSHRNLNSHQIVCQDGRAGKNLCTAPLTGAVAQRLEEGLGGGIFVPEADRVARAGLNVALRQLAHSQPGRALAPEISCRLQLRQLKRNMAWLLLSSEQVESQNQHLLFDHMRQKAKRSVAKEQAVSTQLRRELHDAKQKASQGRHYMAECKEAYNQLKEQLTKEASQRQQRSTQLQAQLQEVQRELTEVTSEAKSGQTVSLQFQIQEMQEQMKGVQDELKAAAAASHSAAKAAQTKHDEEVASHSTAYTTLYKEIVDFKKQLEQQAGSMACLQALLIQARADFAEASSALKDKTEAASVLNIELEQLRCLTGGTAQNQLGSPATTQPGQDPSGVVSRALMLHGTKTVPLLAGLKPKPEQGRAQTLGAVSDSPTAPSSPLIAATNPFAQGSKPALGCKQSPLGSAEAAVHKPPQTGPGQEVNSSQLAAQEGTQQMRACHHPPYTSSPSTTVTLKDVEPQLQDESSKDGDKDCSTTATQLAATESLESIEAKSEPTYAAVCVKNICEKQCQTTLHESELTQEGTTSRPKKDGRAERDESQNGSEEDSMTDSDDESLPGSEGSSSVAPADKRPEASISSADSTKSSSEESSKSVSGHNSTLASATRTQEKKDDSADLDGSDWTIPAEVGVLEGVRGAAPADNALPQGLLQGEDSSAAHMDDAGSQHSQEYDSGSDESSYDSEAESAYDSTEGSEAEGTSETGSNAAVSLEDDGQQDCTTAAQLAAFQSLVERLMQEQQCADIQLAQQQAQLLQKDQLAVDLNLRIADLEGQAAYGHWLKRKTVMPEGDHHALFSMTSETLGCDDLEKKVRASMLKTSGTEKVGVWEWKLSPFSQVVKVLATTEQSRECDVVGSGVGGQVRVACMLMDDGTEQVVVIKPLPYQTPEEILQGNAELAALQDASDCESIVQCWGVFDHRDPFYGKAYVQLIMEYVSGLDLEDAMFALLKSQSEPDFNDRWWKAGKTLLKCLLEGAKWLAEVGRGHCDIKSANIRVQLTADGQGIESAKLVDLGCSLKHKGLKRDCPANFGCTYEFSSPEFVSRDGGKYVDACAQDMWGIGYVAYLFFARNAPWRFGPTVSQGSKHARLDQQHTAWAGTFESANAIEDADSPLLLDLLVEM